MKAAMAQSEKRQRQLEKQVDEGEAKIVQLQAELKDSEVDYRAIVGEMSKLKIQIDDSEGATDAVRKEVKKLTGAPRTDFNSFSVASETLHIYTSWGYMDSDSNFLLQCISFHFYR